MCTIVDWDKKSEAIEDKFEDIRECLIVCPASDECVKKAESAETSDRELASSMFA